MGDGGSCVESTASPSSKEKYEASLVGSEGTGLGTGHKRGKEGRYHGEVFSFEP